MNDVEIGRVGEIVYRAPTLMAGYWNNPLATAEAFTGGWFHSGDHIYCAEVENVLAGHPAIVEVAVIGRSYEKWGEVPVAVVALSAVSDAALTLADLDEFLTERLARYKHPKHLEVVDTLPRNPAGKVLKTELRARYGDSKFIDAGESSSAPSISTGQAQG